MKLDYFLSLILVIKTSDEYSVYNFNTGLLSDYSDFLDPLELSYEGSNQIDDFSTPLIGLNNLGNFQKRNSNETKEQFNIRDNPSNDIEYNNQDIMFNNINDIQTYSQSYLQQLNTDIEEQSYTSLLDYNTSSYIQLQETENDFSYNNSSNYNKEIQVNNTNQDILSNITIQQEERYNNPITHCSNIGNKRMLDINLQEETESKKQKPNETNKLNIIGDNEIEDSINKELIPLSCEEISEFYEEINDSNLLSSDPEKIETEINYDKVKLLERNTEETINPSNLLIQTTSIDNNKEPLEDEKVNYYFIDFINEKTEIQPLLVLKKEINNKSSFRKITNNIWEINFCLNNNFFTWKINIKKSEPLILNLTDKSSSFKIIKEETFNAINIYDSENFFNLTFEIEYPIFRKINFTTSSTNIKYLKIFYDFSLEENINKKITGNIFIQKSESYNFKSPIFVTKNYKKIIQESFYQLLDLKFPIYNFINMGIIKSISIYNTQYTSSYNNEMSIKDYILEFNEIKNSIKAFIHKSKYKSIDMIPITRSPYQNCIPIIILDHAIFLIKDFCISFIKNINEIERILLDSSNITKNEEIKVIFEKIIPHLIPNWRIKITKKLNKDDYKEIKLISFYMFLHQQIREILEKWDKIFSDILLSIDHC